MERIRFQPRGSQIWWLRGNLWIFEILRQWSMRCCPCLWLGRQRWFIHRTFRSVPKMEESWPCNKMYGDTAYDKGVFPPPKIATHKVQDSFPSILGTTEILKVIYRSADLWSFGSFVKRVGFGAWDVALPYLSMVMHRWISIYSLSTYLQCLVGTTLKKNGDWLLRMFVVHPKVVHPACYEWRFKGTPWPKVAFLNGTLPGVPYKWRAPPWQPWSSCRGAAGGFSNLCDAGGNLRILEVPTVSTSAGRRVTGGIFFVDDREFFRAV